MFCFFFVCEARNFFDSQSLKPQKNFGLKSSKFNTCCASSSAEGRNLYLQTTRVLEMENKQQQHTGRAMGLDRELNAERWF